MKMLLLLLMLAAPCTVVPPAASSEGPPLPFSERVPLLGPDAISVLKGAERVEVFRLDQSMMPPGPEDKIEKIVSGYRAISTGKVQGKKFAARLAAVLLDEKTYSGEHKACEPTPGVAFRLWKGKQHVDVTLCFECNMLSVNSVGGDFDLVRPALVSLAKEAFPDDARIQKLRERPPFPQCE